MTATSFSGDGSALTGVANTDVIFTNKIGLGDNERISLGISSDLSIYHDGNDSIIQDSGTGGLYLYTQQFLARNAAGDETQIEAKENSSVDLYYANSAKFQTSGLGVTVTGSMDFVTGGIVTSTSAANIGIVTYHGDVSNAAHQRWEVTADSPNSYVFVGSGVTHGNRHDPTLYVARGSIVEFVNNMGAHPLQIQTSYQNTGGTAYTDGVTVAGSASAGVIRFEVPHNAPNTLYYQCTSHAGMAGTITIYPSI